MCLWKLICHYLNPANTFLGLLFFNGFLAIGIYFAFNYFSIPLSDAIFWPAALGVTGFSLIKWVELKIKRYNVLCRLEVELNQAMDALSNQIYTLNNMVSAAIPIILPHDLPFLTLNYVKAVGRIDVKNNLSNLLCNFRRINQDWNNLVEFGKEHRAIVKDTAHPEHRDIRNIGTKLLSDLLEYAKSTLGLIEDTLVLVRVYLRIDKTIFNSKPPFLCPDKLSAAIQKEKQKLQEEIKNNR